MIVIGAKAVLDIQGKDNLMIKKITLALLLLVLAVGAAGYVYIEQIEKQNADDIEQ